MLRMPEVTGLSLSQAVGKLLDAPARILGLSATDINVRIGTFKRQGASSVSIRVGDAFWVVVQDSVV